MCPPNVKTPRTLRVLLPSSPNEYDLESVAANGVKFPTLKDVRFLMKCLFSGKFGGIFH